MDHLVRTRKYPRHPARNRTWTVAGCQYIYTTCSMPCPSIPQYSQFTCLNQLFYCVCYIGGLEGLLARCLLRTLLRCTPRRRILPLNRLSPCAHCPSGAWLYASSQRGPSQADFDGYVRSDSGDRLQSLILENLWLGGSRTLTHPAGWSYKDIGRALNRCPKLTSPHRSTTSIFRRDPKHGGPYPRTKLEGLYRGGIYLIV